MIIQCQNKRCTWHGTPTFEECDNTIYIKAVCPKCHTFLKLVKRQDVPKNCIIVEKDAWWEKIKATESELRPAYMIQKELSNLRIDHEVLLAENEKLKEIVKEATDIITDALECEGILKHIPKWLKE